MNAKEQILVLEEKIAKEKEKISIKKESIKTYQKKIENVEEQIALVDSKISNMEDKIKNLKEKEYAKELKIIMKRKDEFVALMLDAIIVGADTLKVRHGQIAPYSYGYEIRKNIDGKFTSISKCYNGSWYSTLPEELFNYYLNKCKWTLADFENFKVEVDGLWKNLPATYNERTYTPPKSNWDRGYIADGYELDGFANIVSGKCGGTYSSCTTSAQNTLAKELIILKGYCVDYAIKNNKIYSPELLAIASQVFARHGIDNKLVSATAWAKRNPNRAYRTSAA